MADWQDRDYNTVERVALPLLTRITVQALDEDYAHVARQRRTRGRPTRRTVTWWSWLGVTVLVGGLFAVAGAQSSEQAVASQSSRATLITRVGVQREDLRDRQERVARLEAATVGAQGDLDEASGQLSDLQDQLARVGESVGTGPVSGPGVRIVVDDAPAGPTAEIVRGADLALLVNGLWSAGAEAIAINGQRLTALSYIQNSGPVVNVNSRPLLPPYTVEALGDTRTLQADLLESASGAQFAGYAQVFDFRFDRQNVDQLQLSAATPRRLRAATIGQAGDVPVPPIQAPTEGGTP